MADPPHPALVKAVNKLCMDASVCRFPNCNCHTKQVAIAAFATGRAVGPEREIVTWEWSLASTDGGSGVWLTADRDALLAKAAGFNPTTILGHGPTEAAAIEDLKRKAGETK